MCISISSNRSLNIHLLIINLHFQNFLVPNESKSIVAVIALDFLTSSLSQFLTLR